MQGNVTEAELREQPIGDLIKRLAGETSTLVQQEIALARAEMTQKAKQGAAAGGMLGGAAVAGLLTAMALTACAIAALATAMHVWLAALIVGALLALATGGLAIGGRDRLRRATPPVPEQTIETVKEDVEWAKTRRRSARR